MANSEENIFAAKQGFEAAFSEKSFYNRQTQDSSHIEAILGILPIQSEMIVLDLGTGSGYLAFALAKKYPDVTVVGLDIVEKALEQNRLRAAEEGLSNISFISYNGKLLPFDDKSFDIVVTRYALHHFPDIAMSLSEVSRIMSDKGCFFISDPTPNADDKSGFADEYMQAKPDGHIKLRCLDEWKSLCERCGFKLADFFESSIRFPRKYEKKYETIMKRHPKETVSSYDIEVKDDEIFITEQVNNMLFRKGI
jgi:ubiquinone/menaquinone biosynthesis C-methylase UbiE